MEYENMRVTELKALASDCGLRNYYRMRKAELVALLQNNPPPSPWSRAPTGPYTSEVTKHSPSGWSVYSKFAYGEIRIHYHHNIFDTLHVLQK